MLIDSQLTKQWLNEWLNDNCIKVAREYTIKVHIRTYVQDKISITLSYDNEAMHTPVVHEPILLERNPAGIKRTVINWLENNKEQILYQQEWLDFVKTLDSIDEFREKENE